MIDRLGRPLGDRSRPRRPRRPPRTAGPTAEHHVRRLGSISLPSCVSHNSLGPRRRIGRPSRLRVCLADKAAAAAEPRHGDCRGVGTKGFKLAQPRPSLGRKNEFQGQKLRSPLDNRHRGGEREPLREAGGRTEPTHGRGAARGGEGWRSGGGAEEEGSVRAWRFGLSLAGPDAISEMGARGACGCCLPWKRKPRGPAGMELGGGWPASMTTVIGESKFFSKSGSSLRNERASSAR